MPKKLNHKKFEKLMDIVKDDSFVFIDDEGNEIFEGGTAASSPLGNVMHRFRYCLVVSTKRGQKITQHQKDILKNKFQKIFQANDSKIEEIHFFQNYALMRILVPFNKAVGQVVDDALKPLSKSGGFLRFHYLVTNTHKPTREEIQEYLTDLSHKKE